ncbi:MAG: prepilin-type N-terminal cleavage/methylation domain-containing protein [Candidatus Paceibacterota bacterium]|jgi:prepilin-type N-terminal cleavage/methylation domain-containing protein
MKNNFHTRGLTIVEILVVLAVLGIILAVITPPFSKSREKQLVNTAVGDTLSSLSKARAETLASKDSSSYGVHFESGAVIIFKGTSYSAGAGDNEEISILAPANISNVTLGGTSGGSGDLYFKRISGEPNKAGTVTISSPEFSKIITITATGSASAQ